MISLSTTPLSQKSTGSAETEFTVGCMKQQTGFRLNYDVNGALNIMRKSSVVDLSVLYGRGEVDTPVRIRVA